jgi:hypothetical protein
MADRTVSVKLKAEISDYNAKMRAAGLATEKVGRSTERVAKRANLHWRLLLGAIAAGAPAASALAIGAAVGGVSTAFIGLGAVALRENERIKQSLEELSHEVNSGLAEDASVLEDAFVGAAGEIGDAFQEMRPQLRQAFSAAEPLVGKLTDGVINLAENAMPGLVTSVERAGPVFDGFGSLLGSTGAGLSAFFEAISEHSEEAGQGMEHLGQLVEGVLPGLGDIVGDLTDLWAEHGDEAVDVVTRIVEVLGGLTGGALPVLGDALDVAFDALDGVLDVIEPMEGIIGPAAGAWLALALAMKGMRGVGSIVGGAASSIALLGDNSDKARGKISRLGRAAAGAGIAFGGMQIAGDALNGLFGDPLNANVDALAEGLVRLGHDGKASGEVARVLGDDLGALDDAFWALTGWDVELRRFMQGAAGGFDNVSTSVAGAEKRFGEIDDALASLVEEGRAGDAADAFGRLAQQATEAGMPIDDLKALLPDYAAAQEVAAGKTQGMADATSNAATSLADYLEQQRIATDPVFALGNAVERVGEAQVAYNEAVAEYGAKSPEASSAAWDLAEAVAGAEQAALNGDLSFGAFKDKLATWVAQGLITQAQADTLAGRVANLRGEAENYAGPYSARLSAEDNASHIIGHVKGELLGLRDKTVTITTRFVSAGHGPTAANRLLSSTGADGGLVTHGGILPRFAGGGEVHGPGGPRSDIVPALLSNGEFVVNAAATSKHLALLKALNQNKFASGGFVSGMNMAIRQVPQSSAPSPKGIHVENLNVRAYSDRFSIRQVQDDLAMHGVA